MRIFWTPIIGGGHYGIVGGQNSKNSESEEKKRFSAFGSIWMILDRFSLSLGEIMCIWMIIEEKQAI